MANDYLLKLAEQFLKESGAEGPVHRRLRGRLEEFAARLGMERVLGQLDGNIPDVYRVTWTKPLVALVADAKDSKNQRLADSADQIRQYFASVTVRIKTGVFKGAVVIVATDNREVAEEWVKGLAGFAVDTGLELTQAPGLNEQDGETYFAIAVAGG